MSAGSELETLIKQLGKVDKTLDANTAALNKKREKIIENLNKLLNQMNVVKEADNTQSLINKSEGDITILKGEIQNLNDLILDAEQNNKAQNELNKLIEAVESILQRIRDAATTASDAQNTFLENVKGIIKN